MSYDVDPPYAEESAYDDVSFQGHLGTLKLSDERVSFHDAANEKVSVIPWSKVEKRQVASAKRSRVLKHLVKLILSSGTEVIFEVKDRVILEILRDDFKDRMETWRKLIAPKQNSNVINETQGKAPRRQSTPYSMSNADMQNPEDFDHAQYPDHEKSPRAMPDMYGDPEEVNRTHAKAPRRESTPYNMTHADLQYPDYMERAQNVDPVSNPYAMPNLYGHPEEVNKIHAKAPRRESTPYSMSNSDLENPDYMERAQEAGQDSAPYGMPNMDSYPEEVNRTHAKAPRRESTPYSMPNPNITEEGAAAELARRREQERAAEEARLREEARQRHLADVEEAHKEAMGKQRQELREVQDKAALEARRAEEQEARDYGVRRSQEEAQKARERAKAEKVAREAAKQEALYAAKQEELRRAAERQQQLQKEVDEAKRREEAAEAARRADVERAFEAGRAAEREAAARKQQQEDGWRAVEQQRRQQKAAEEAIKLEAKREAEAAARRAAEEEWALEARRAAERAEARRQQQEAEQRAAAQQKRKQQAAEEARKREAATRKQQEEAERRAVEQRRQQAAEEERKREAAAAAKKRQQEAERRAAQQRHQQAAEEARQKEAEAARKGSVQRALEARKARERQEQQAAQRAAEQHAAAEEADAARRAAEAAKREREAANKKRKEQQRQQQAQTKAQKQQKVVQAKKLADQAHKKADEERLRKWKEREEERKRKRKAQTAKSPTPFVERVPKLSALLAMGGPGAAEYKKQKEAAKLAKWNANLGDKWQVLHQTYNGGSISEVTKEEVKKGISKDQAMELFHSDPEKYLALHYWPENPTEFTFILRADTIGYEPQGVRDDNGGNFVIVRHMYQRLPPLKNDVLPKPYRDKYTDDMTFGGQKLHSNRNKPLLPGRGMGLGDEANMEFLDFPQPGHVRQGGCVGDCWLLSAIACLADFDWAVERLFRKMKQRLQECPHDPPNQYTVTLWDLCTWKEVDVLIDERLPVRPGGGLLGARPSREGKFWVPYLEKAIAAHCGGYDKICGGNCTDAWPMMTGSRNQYMITKIPNKKKYQCNAKFNPNTQEWSDHSNSPHNSNPAHWKIDWPSVGGGGDRDLELTENQLFERIIAWDENNYLLGAGTSGKSDKDKTDGLVDAHAYSIIDSRQNICGTGIDLLLIRNPWGEGGELETGQFMRTGPGWKRYPNIRKELNPVMEDHGLCWVTKSEFFKYFPTIYVCALNMTRLKDPNYVNDLKNDFKPRPKPGAKASTPVKVAVAPNSSDGDRVRIDRRPYKASSKYKLVEQSFSGGVAFCKLNKKDFQGKSIAQGVTEFRSNPKKYLAIHWQNTIVTEGWPISEHRYTMIYRDGTDGLEVGVVKNGRRTILMNELSKKR